MPTTFKSFEAQMKRIKIDTVDGVGRVKRKVALAALSSVVLATPVDTGRARGNWQVSLAAPILNEIETEDKSGGPTIAKGTGVIGTSTLEAPIFLANNVPYIVVLNDGSSVQAPAMFVEKALEFAVSSVAGARVL